MQLSDGSYIDTQGRPVDVSQMGVDTSAPIRYQVSEHSQEALFDMTQNNSQFVMPSSTLPSNTPSSTLPSNAPSSTLPSLPAPSNNNTQMSVISVPSVQSVVNSVRSDGERRLVSQEPKSDLFEDHLLPHLNEGVQTDKDFNI